jgi:hypothetical protein
MTEYETAMLALEVAQGVREQGFLDQAQIALVQTQAEILSSASLNFFTILSGYLLVAHFVAAQLSRGQAVVLNFLYIYIMAISVLGAHTAYIAGVRLTEARAEITPESIPESFWSLEGVWGLNAMSSLCIMASLYFFYSSRRNGSA